MDQNGFLPVGMSQSGPQAYFTPQFDFRGASCQGDGGLPPSIQGAAPTRPGCREPGSDRLKIPWGRPGTGCTLLFEALAVALLRRMPLSSAAGILRRLDNRLWRVATPVQDQPGQGGEQPQFLRIDHPSGRNAGTCLGVCYDLDSSYTVVAASRICFNQKGSDAGAGSEEVRGLFLIAVIEAFLKAAAAPGRRSMAGNPGAAPGKVSAEEAVLFPSQSRAPPRAAGASAREGLEERGSKAAPAA